ncbi:hypothetical protein E2C01_030498 [Portunus trituberculatus]|uniref:Uncharacterized protein n=1 Tax=Portunus trituberculatus TaxID=210409 RepID=A0A5B7EUE6_PORTR|nr:hypothetical protein [Portunus trituberculatus]
MLLNNILHLGNNGRTVSPSRLPREGAESLGKTRIDDGGSSQLTLARSRGQEVHMRLNAVRPRVDSF